MTDQWITVPVEPTLEMIRAETAEKRAAESEANARLAIDRMVKAEMRADAAEADLKIADDALHDLDEKLHQAEAKLRAVKPYLQHKETYQLTCDSLMPTLDPSKARRPCNCGLDELEALLKGDA